MSFKVGDLVRTKPMKVTTISDIDRESPGRSENIFYQLENTSIHRADDIEPLPTQPNEGMLPLLKELTNVQRVAFEKVIDSVGDGSTLDKLYERFRAALAAVGK